MTACPVTHGGASAGISGDGGLGFLGVLYFGHLGSFIRVNFRVLLFAVIF